MTPLDALHHLADRPTRSALAAARRALAVASAGPLRDRLAAAVAGAEALPVPAPETVVTLARACLDLLPALPVAGVGKVGGVAFGRMTDGERIALGAIERDLTGLVTYPSTYEASRVLSIARAAYRHAWTAEAREAAARLEQWATRAERAEIEARVAAAVAESAARVGALGQSGAARASGR